MSCHLGALNHSTTVATFIDGQGSAKFDIQGIPDKLMSIGVAMAEAVANYGDSLMVHVGPERAQTFNTNYSEGKCTYFTQTHVFPKAN
jgi:hypothetical protein